MVLCLRLLTTAVLVAGLGIAPAAHAEHWHGGGNYRGGGNYHHGGGGNAAGAAIIGGIIGLGVGAAIASQRVLRGTAAAGLLRVAASLLLRTAAARLLRLLSRLPTGACHLLRPRDNALPNRGQHQTEERFDEDNPVEPSCFCGHRCAAGASRRGAGATRPVSRAGRAASSRILADDLPARFGQEHGGAGREPYQTTARAIAHHPGRAAAVGSVRPGHARKRPGHGSGFIQRAQQYPTMNAMQNMQS